MNLTNTLRIGAAGTCLLMLAAAYQRTQSAPIMADAANAFLASLTPEQSKKAVMDFKDEERFNFHFIPRERKGLPLREMTPPQKHLAHALLSAGLSQKGAIKASTIMSLEDVLRILENDSGERRNPEKYYFTIFGQPSATGTWGYRIEGHHLAQNFTVVNGKIASTPSFYGANPAEVREGPRKGLRALAAEEDLGREFYMSLTPAQRKTATVSAEAYKDILTAADRKAALKGQPSGLQVTGLNASQKALLTRLVEEYAYNMPEQVAQARMAQYQKAANNVHFAWAGVAEKGGPHYYRVQTPTFLIEYDNTQNNANHIHSVWRDYEGDFGLDLLNQHYQTSHR
ncbi:MAG TPA: DUF3500 domain-containing protein [Bryobacteraceae bacterium]|nr:DUF3500 domain-containing protein [Bryobacteraceae bacterium]